MKLISLKNIKDGRYLKNYELTYVNKQGKEKVYEIVSRSGIENPEDLGKKVSGVSIVAYQGDKMLLLKEFRMGVNKFIYNLCAGMLNEKETIEDCVRRELYEETGLRVTGIIDILPPSYAAVAISDVRTRIAFVEVSGEFEDHTSDNELIYPAFYTGPEVAELLKTQEFSSRAQIAAYNFVKYGR